MWVSGPIIFFPKWVTICSSAMYWIVPPLARVLCHFTILYLNDSVLDSSVLFIKLSISAQTVHDAVLIIVILMRLDIW